MLFLQSNEFKDKEAILSKFKETEERIKSMALVHETLYRSNDLAKVNFSSYIETLASNLIISYGADSEKIKLNINVKGSKINLDHSIPLGLIINELISNSLKHAFPDNIKGEINIKLHTQDKGTVKLIVSDNGVGISDDFDIETTESLGLHLIYILVKDQLSGKVILDRTNGTSFIITFKE